MPPSRLPSKDSTRSFWHSEPSPFLLGHRTTPDLPAHADAVIIGSGITGASAARYLAEDERADGLDMVMLEAREACWGATGRNGGHCQPLIIDALPDVVEFEIRNYNEVRDYIARHDVPCEWQATHACRSYWTPGLASLAAEEVAHLQHDAPDLARHIRLEDDSEQLKSKHWINGAPLASITDTAASLWPYKLVAFQLEQAIHSGRLNLQTNTPADAIEPIPITSTDDSHAARNPRWQVKTPRGSIAARHIILATNAYTSHLLPSFAELIVPVRGTMSALHPPRAAPRLPNSYGFVGANGSTPWQDDYLNQRPSSGVPNPAAHYMFGGGRVTATLPSVGETDDSVLDPGSAAYLRRELLHLLTLNKYTEDYVVEFSTKDPDAGLVPNPDAELKAANIWSGIWGTSKDRTPWVGPVPTHLSDSQSGDGGGGLWLSAGYSGHGMPNATLCAKAVVQMLLADESERSAVTDKNEGPPANGDKKKPIGGLTALLDEMVRSRDIPRSYLITSERIARLEDVASVYEQEEEAGRAEEEGRKFPARIARLRV